MSGEQVVTTLTIDARGAEAGSAAYVKAMRAAQAAADRTFDAHNKAREASSKAATQTIREAETIQRSSAAWDRLRSSVDQVAAAQIKAQREIERATIAADSAVKRGIATQVEAARVIDLVRQQQARFVAEARNLAAGQPLEKAFTAISTAAQAAQATMTRSISEGAQAAERARREYANLEGQMDQQVQRQHRLAEAQRVVNAAVAAGVVSQQQGARTLAQFGDTSRLTHYQLSNLSFQLNDVIQGFAIGQRPMSILTQQGFQVVQAMGGIGNTLRAIVSPIGLAVAGFAALAAAIATVIARASSLEATGRQIAGLNAAMGGASGLTTREVEGITRGVAAAPGFSRADTEAASSILLGNRNITGDSFQRTLALGRDLALLTRQELPEAMQTLVAALTGGEAGLKRLDQQYNIFTVDQIKLIEQLERQGRVQDQVRIGLDAMADRFAGRGTAAISDMRKALDQAGKGFDDFVTGIAKSPVGQSALAYLKLQAELLERAGRAVNPNTPRPIRTRDDVERDLDNLRASAAQGGGEAYYRPRIAALEEELRKFSYVGPEGAAAGVEKAYAEFAKVSREAQEAEKKLASLISRLDPAGKEFRDLAADVETLVNALDRATDPERAAQLEAALRTAGRALADAQNGLDRTTQTDQEARDREHVDSFDRRQRAIEEARRRAERAYEALPEAQRSRTDRDKFIQDQIDQVTSSIRTSVRDMMEDIDAAARHALSIAKAFGQGLKEGYLAEAKAAIDEMVRTTPGLEGQEGALLRQRLQQEASQAIAALGRQSAVQLPNVVAQERMADAEERGARAIREAAIATQVYVGTYEARVRAELANNPAITAEYEKQRAILEDLVRRQSEAQRRVEAIQLNRQYDPRAQYAFEISRLRDLAETGRVSSRAVEAAWREAYINMGVASGSWTDGATAGLLEYARQAERVGAAVADIMVRTFATIEDALARVLLGMRVDVGNVLREIGLDVARTFIRQNITGPIAGFFGNLFSGGVPGIAGFGQPMSSSVAGGVGTQALSGNGVGGGGGFNLLGMLGGGGGGGWLSRQFGSLGTWLNTPFSNMAMFGGPSSMMGAGLGAMAAGSGTGIGASLGGMASGGGFLSGLTPMGAIGGIAGIGSGIFSLATGGGSASSLVSGIGSMIGGAVSMIPGVGQILGPIIMIGSQLLGGLLKKEPTYASQGWHTYDRALGSYTGRVAYEENMKAIVEPGIGNDVLKFLGQYGGRVAEGQSAPGYYIWRGYKDGRMDATLTAEDSPEYRRLLEKVQQDGIAKGTDEIQWAARTELWTDAPVNGRWTPLPIHELSTDSEKLMQQLALLIMKAGVREGSITGLSATSQKIIRNFPDADTEGLAQALEWGKKTYDVLIRPETMTEAERTITDLQDTFRSAILEAEKYRLATDKLTEAQTRAINQVATGFNQNLDDRILGLTDPAALQLVQLDREFEQLRKEAAYLNDQYAQGLIDTLVDLNKIEQAYGLERERIVKDQLTSLMDLWKRLTYGDLSSASPVVTLAGAQSTYDDVIARARAGSATALADLPGAADDLINAQRAYTGNDSRFEALRTSILSDIAPYVAANSNGASTGTVAFDVQSNQAIAELMVAMQQEREANAELNQRVADLTRTVERLIGKMAA